MATKSGLWLYMGDGFGDAMVGWATSSVWASKYRACEVDLDAGLPDEVTSLYVQRHVAPHDVFLSDRSVFHMLLAHPGRVQQIRLDHLDDTEVTPACIELLGTSTTLTSVIMEGLIIRGRRQTRIFDALLALSRNAHITDLQLNKYDEDRVAVPLRALDPAVQFSFITTLQIDGYEYYLTDRPCDTLRLLFAMFPRLHTLMIERDFDYDFDWWTPNPDDFCAIDDMPTLDEVGTLYLDTRDSLLAFLEWLARTHVGVVHVCVNDAVVAEHLAASAPEEEEESDGAIARIFTHIAGANPHLRELTVDDIPIFSHPLLK